MNESRPLGECEWLSTKPRSKIMKIKTIGSTTARLSVLVLMLTAVSASFLLSGVHAADQSTSPPLLRISGQDPVVIGIQGGTPPFQLQSRSRITQGLWLDEGPPVWDMEVKIGNHVSTKFFRILSLEGLGGEDYFYDDFDTDRERPVSWESGLATAPALFSTGLHEVTDEGWLWVPSNRQSMSAYVADLRFRDVSVHTQVRNLGIRPLVSGSVRINARDGYWAGINPSGQLSITAGGLVVASARSDLDVIDNDIHLHFVVVGDSLSLTAWADGEPRPNAPQVTVEDDGLFSPGHVGLFHNPKQSNAAVIFRFFEVRSLD